MTGRAFAWGERTWIETYVFPNSASVAKDAITQHLTTVDAIEFASNQNLWAPLPDDIEDTLEASTQSPPTLEELEDSQ